ncbi:MAG: class I SAM-dependent methyltransferase [Clostridiales bacterium]|nr:class I SAM-dependent methyltransferase [Clostridiales bacterium]
MEREYTAINSETIDRWVDGGWEWSVPIDHGTFVRAQAGDWSVLLTPTRPVPRAWFGELDGARVLGLASGGGQQMPIFAAAGAICTVLDNSERQLDQERLIAGREGYGITIVRADMTKPFPFADQSFDLIFHPVSNCYVEDVLPIWRECFRVLRPGGALLAGLDNGVAYAFDDAGERLIQKLPFNPLKDEALYARSIENGDGIQFSHPIEEQVGGQLDAGFVLTAIFQDTCGSGGLHRFGVPTFFATRAIRP